MNIAQHASWRDSLLDIASEQPEGSFYGRWHRMFDETFLDRAFFFRVYDAMRSLIDCCPDERYLVHADYGFGNVLVQDGKITAVLDWANAAYGDFMYDVAWLTIGYPQHDVPGMFRGFYREKGRQVPNFDDRLLCCQLYISLDSQVWYAKSNQPTQYARMRAYTEELLN